MTIEQFKERLKPLGILYVDVYPYRLNSEKQPEFLLMRRNDGVELPSTWQAISGKIREGERIRHAFWRQSEKKLGIKPKRIFKVDFVNTFYDDYYDTVMCVPTAACELVGNEEIKMSELHTEFKWVDIKDINSYLIWPNQITVIHMIKNMLENNLISKFHTLSDTDA